MHFPTMHKQMEKVAYLSSLALLLGLLCSLFGTSQCLTVSYKKLFRVLAQQNLGVKRTVTINTRLGQVTGLQNHQANMFHGIPYALPPVGDLRWANPVSVKDEDFLDDTYDATYDRDGCPQAKIRDPANPLDAGCLTVSEDCLYLNIFSPLSRSRSGHPVLVYLHGGYFVMNCGSAPVFNGANFAGRNDVVVVTLNYRLGAMGFLWTGSDGNWGMKDQQSALKWVAANIADYGGDPGQVTLMGQSAGAESVGIHLFWDDSSSLFHRAILSSAPFSVPQRTLGEGGNMTLKLARNLTCVDKIGQANITCLRQLPWETIRDQQDTPDYKDSLHFLTQFQDWSPVVDNVVVKHQLLYWPRTKSIYKPIILGTTQDEGVFLVNAAPLAKDGLDYFEYLGLLGQIKGKYMDHILKLYPSISFLDERPEAYKLVTDLVFYCSARNFSFETQRHSEADIWMYVFSYAPSLDSSTDEWAQICSGKVCHGTDVPFSLNTVPLLGSMGFPITSTDVYFAKVLSDYLADFVRDGKVDRSKPSRWPIHERGTRTRVLKLGPRSVRLVEGDRTAKCDMWDRIGFRLDV